MANNVQISKEFSVRLNAILDKKNYDSKLKGIFRRIAVGMVVYYGSQVEEAVLNVFSNTYIYVAKENDDPERFINDYFSVPVKYSVVPEQISAVYLWVAIPDGEQIKFESLVHLPAELNCLDLSVDNPLYNYCLQVLIHELNHCLKTNGYYRKINDTVIEIASGINRTVYDTKTIPYDVLNDKYDATEEAMNTIQEYEMFTLITGRTPENVGCYRNSQKRFRALLEFVPGLKEIITRSEFDKTNDWIDKIGLKNADKLDALLKKEHQNPGHVLVPGSLDMVDFLQVCNEIISSGRRLKR